MEFGHNKLSKCTVRARTVSPGSLSGQSISKTLSGSVFGSGFAWILKRYFRAVFSRGICGRYLRAVFPGNVFTSVIETWLPGKCSRDCFLKVVPASVLRKCFAGMPLLTASGTSFQKASPGNVFGAWFLEGFSGQRRFFLCF